MKKLKVKYNSVDFEGNGLVSLRKHLVNTVLKHGYTHAQLDGKVYVLDIVYNMPKNKGYLPAIYLDYKTYHL